MSGTRRTSVAEYEHRAREISFSRFQNPGIPTTKSRRFSENHFYDKMLAVDDKKAHVKASDSETHAGGIQDTELALSNRQLVDLSHVYLSATVRSLSLIKCSLESLKGIGRAVNLERLDLSHVKTFTPEMCH
jgi:hypothetical protein